MAKIIEEESKGARVVIQSERFGDPAIEHVKKTLVLKYDREAHDAGRKGLWWIGKAKRAELERLLAEVATLPFEETKKEEDVSKCRVYAKVKYKGRGWYVIAESHAQNRCRICNLDGKGPTGGGPAWVDMADCDMEKTYEAREFRGQPQYSTIGSLKRFRDRQANPETARVQCPECDAWHDANESCRECGGC